MKKNLVLAFSIAFLGSSFSIPAFGAVKAGASCTKAGSTSIASGKKFTCVKTGKKLTWDKGVKISTPSPIEKTTPSPTPSPTPDLPSQNSSGPSTSASPSSSVDSLPTFLSSQKNIDTCRVPDSRTSHNISEAIAYPVNSGNHPAPFPSVGTLNVAVIPIDFPDVPGTGSPSTFLSGEIQEAKKWVEYFSNGKLHYNFQTTDKWIRANRDSSYFNWVHPGSQGNPLPNANSKNSRSAHEITTELLKYAEKDFNYKNLDIVFFVYPKNIVNIWDAMTSWGIISTNVGTINIQISATGAWLYRNDFPIWPWFIHENMHPQGLAGHAPFDGSPFNIMTNQAGASFVLDAWDQATLDWQADNEIYCTSTEDLMPVTIPMNPIDNIDSRGTKSIFVKLSDHEVLVIESRRKAYWSQGWLTYKGLPDDFRGLLVYKVDTSIDINRVETGGFANYVMNKSANNGNYQGPYSPHFSLNYLVKPGQSLETNGIKVSLQDSGIFDLVRLSKTS